MYYRITTLETKVHQQAIDLDKLHRKVHTLDEALRLKSGESSGEISPALPVIGTFSTGEVRRSTACRRILAAPVAYLEGGLLR